MIIWLNNIQYNLWKNSLGVIIQVVDFFNYNLPRFCYNEFLNIAGNCRMCFVEVFKAPKPLVSCSTPLMNKSSIFLNTPLVQKARENNLEFLLVNHPLDCPICDQGGVCDLQDYTKDFGSDKSRNFNLNKRKVEDKNLGFVVKTTMTRCIHCTRCVRFLEKFGDNETLKAFGRGGSMEIGSYINKFITSEFSGNLIDLCPVGALTCNINKFRTRHWELKKSKVIDFTNTSGTLLEAHIRHKSIANNHKKNISKKKGGKSIFKLTPLYDIENNFSFISDKSRYYYDF